ncbi:citramalate synthase [Patescibacteria group bacterium]|nr:citramalate synthase [Patescibacteria group bacterium]MBU1123065.1 citramalate synthase [Patescibacteria group bacterium]MBU1911357.1 citramalate synthase [Patescibacteria group bacterium]
MPEKEKIILYDATPRDGDQGGGIKLGKKGKIAIARLSDDFGIDIVEAGYPAANADDVEVFEELAEDPLRNAKVAAFGMTIRKDMTAEKDGFMQGVIRVPTDIATIVGKSSRFQVEEIVKAKPDENLRMIGDTFRYLKQDISVDDLIFDAEHFFDGYKQDSDYSLSALQAAYEEGIKSITLCDTNGGAMPWEVEEATEEVRRRFADLLIGIHVHNCGDLGTANTLYAVRAGARLVQGTWNGYGERTGNADLCQIIANLRKMDKFDLPATEELTEASKKAASIAKQSRNPRQPHVGKHAYWHKGGMHASGMNRHSEAYESSPPEWWGNERRIVGSIQSGRSNLVSIVKRLPVLNKEVRDRILHDSELQDRLVRSLKKREAEGYAYEEADASMTLLILKELEMFEPVINELDNPKILDEVGGPTIAFVKVSINGDDTPLHEVGEGGGPLGCLNSALRKALKDSHPELKDLKLVLYRAGVPEDILNGTSSIIQVIMEVTDGTNTWTTTGADEDSTKAGWDAFKDAIEYKILMDKTNQSSESDDEE